MGNLIPEQKNIQEGSLQEQRERLTLEELNEKLRKEKEGIGSIHMPTSVPESDEIKRGS
ncbi:MAG: hypothetical protein UR33_C0004G0050 [Candidatus Woesebacteria bacterium GW2011_GWA2_33_20]|uniref:Uncharacterized protein n=1 Tax=Candidatus Woesebacteria bacterium GW2011_GWB1_33_22 TaxID=1618566 RepID=A0A0G0A1J8_9BACT|nr:MAG: hypothetical protein UR33_C0004G0050 [Candidatus Woesebacteria bacterium GW2011_GWA2_33_20]KKP45021.1 MAG: hypothetical protein UR35_C0004G0053 [Candidatus Woesebacteria bacterium GW2011_GWB1_33_22]KKP46870.1 MAG: hypothetical protein UR37_C0004G0049 [Microgenomates group bacterium GW2011_GWC1_33_28]KKP50743.1 MAG: hypothetical protein UR41_C0004G0054 [Candidatus Woesebacteria bacterium GW2011_GWA1_33_33]